jgi:hypothetical protein
MDSKRYYQRQEESWIAFFPSYTPGTEPCINLAISSDPKFQTDPCILVA